MCELVAADSEVQEMIAAERQSEAKEDFAPDTSGWDDPVPLSSNTLPDFPVDALTPVLRDYALAVSEATQTAIDMAAVGTLTTASACMRNLYKVEGKADWREPTNIYGVIIADPSEPASSSNGSPWKAQAARAWGSTTGGWTTFDRWNNTTATTFTDTAVYAGTRYQYGVKAYYTNPFDVYNLGMVGPLKTTVRITTRTLASVTPGANKITAKWNKSSVFTGYQVEASTDANFKKDVKTVKLADWDYDKTTVTGLKADTTYYVRVRSYQLFEGMTYYGGWSNVLSAKTPK